ncbi:unnamed protein product (macronuclear) [Paramecium tetraurelia]|uniref:Signal peptidase complex subunit 3 n=1 Tax=Paramecium tetraurelia TaxID=5888 RepID=A0BS79_PARTE|nr:uncharacterized protein GSPATT00031627001 [Paramecium tetraurelia]CAK61396.1 unnamed protein product [Paramecium tetraurelia]|eukprot:XP_001428794.1 hypothetical protein (macronuclear) [Paramecium tetraurelia strain d4-2]
MYSITARFNQIVFFTSWTLVVLSLLNQGTAYFFKTGKPTVDLKILSADKFQHYKATYYNGGATDWDQVTFKFSLEADFEPVYNWNLKQLFLYVNVHHEHQQKGYESDCVIYDKIISRPDDPSSWSTSSKLVLKNQRAEYPLKDIHKQLRNATVNFEVWIEVMPYVGYIRREKLGDFEYKMPQQYN